MHNEIALFGTIQFSRTRFADEDNYSSYFLGGNGLITSLAVAKYVKVHLISIVGNDMNKSSLSSFLGPNINIDNVSFEQGKTFQYDVSFDRKSGDIVQESIDFGVYRSYKPTILSEDARICNHIYFSGSNPNISLEVLQQLIKPKLIGVNLLYYHLQYNAKAFLDLINCATHLFANRREFIFLQSIVGKSDIFAAFPKLIYIFQTNGKEGVKVMTRDKELSFRAPMLAVVQNPLNAGDIFAGTLFGQLVYNTNFNRDLPQIILSAQKEAIKAISSKFRYHI